MADGKVKGFFVVGENPVVGSANGRLQCRALANLDWLVVRDLVEIETAAFWYDSPEIESGDVRTADIGTEVFFLPAAAHTEKDGSFTNTQRLLQWHHAAVEPPGDCRSDLWFYFHLGRLIKDKLAGSTEGRDRPVLDLTWDYPTHGPVAEPDAEAILREISGWGPGGAVDGYTDLKADGTTSCGCWIYSGSYAGEINQAARRRPGSEQSWVAPEWGWAWPANRRILYNRASADPDGRPWSERKRYVWWDDEAGRWTGGDVPDFVSTMRPDHRPADGATAEKALRGDEPFVMQTDGRGWLLTPSGLVDGPLPAHYEPHESPFTLPLRPAVEPGAPGLRPAAKPLQPQWRPARLRRLSLRGEHLPAHRTPHRRRHEPLPRLPVRALTGHVLRGRPRAGRRAGAGQRRVGHRGDGPIGHRGPGPGDRAHALATIQGRTVHQVGLPYHWGRRGLSVGDSANDLAGVVLDPNVHIQESKAATCDIRPGRRPRGADLTRLVTEYQARAGIEGEGP